MKNRIIQIILVLAFIALVIFTYLVWDYGDTVHKQLKQGIIENGTTER